MLMNLRFLLWSDGSVKCIVLYMVNQLVIAVINVAFREVMQSDEILVVILCHVFSISIFEQSAHNVIRVFQPYHRISLQHCIPVGV